MYRFSAVLFDFDGTLAYTASDVWVSVRYGFESAGLILDEDYAGDDRNLAYTVGEMIKALYPGASEEQIRIAEENCNRHYRYVNSFDNTVMYEGIKELLEFIRAENIPCGVLSNKGHISLSRLLKEKGWDIYFDRFQGTTDESYGLSKTIRLREFVKHFDISNAIYIGDSYTDITAARDNGLLSAGVLYGDGDRELVKREHPDYLFDTAVDLLDCFRRGLF